MKYPLLTRGISATDLVPVRDRARAVAELSGLDKLDCTRFVTAVSEVTRNATQHAAGGSITFLLETDRADTQQVVAEITDNRPAHGEGAGTAEAQRLAAGKRLADRFVVHRTQEGATVVTLAMNLPRGSPTVADARVAAIVDNLNRRKRATPVEELELQYAETLATVQALKDRQAELEKADVRKNQFVATLAHELRNPLGTLQMTLYVLRHNAQFQSPDVLKHLAVMTRQTAQMNALVQDLLDVARVGEGKVELKLSPTNINEIVSQAVEMTGAEISAKHHEVDISLHVEPLWVQADATRLKQVLSNLMQNAARYSAERGRITVSVSRAEANAVVEVADRGIGIAAHLLPHVFGLFVQGERAADAPSAGLGIGLALVQRLVQEHGGTVTAASAGLGHGSCFTVTLPLCPGKE
jgi:signal transduction histidine kinase